MFGLGCKWTKKTKGRALIKNSKVAGRGISGRSYAFLPPQSPLLPGITAFLPVGSQN
jgi:hypothetical protein